ncbi:MAG: LamG-like jellyroll fold domain-containing protein, partial [Bacteroidota bacterium]|nr:LamG-like jellyroll fold domain-containing protein [Bacteroidota bacterium]
GDLSAVKYNLTLPTKGTLDPTIMISWKSSCSQIISNTGVVTRPDFYNFNVILTATLTKGYQRVTKSFPATVVVKDGTPFASNLLVNYDFSQVSDSVVTDVAEKHFTGKVKNVAKIRTIGNTGKQFNVVDLGNSTGYFDLGTDMGKVIYHLNDYTMGAYFRIDDSYSEINSWGNLLWNFSNSTNAVNDPKGTMYAGLKNQNVQITGTWYGDGEQGVSFGANASKGTWNYFAYTQKDTIGTIYINGTPIASGTVKNTPAKVMPKDGFVGTICNWMGRPIYGADVYLRNTLVYGFHLYSSALSETEIVAKANLVTDLNEAYIANPGTSAVTKVSIENIRVITEQGMIRISGLTESDKVSVYDIMGRKVTVKNAETITVTPGMYIVKINDIVREVIVK